MVSDERVLIERDDVLADIGHRLERARVGAGSVLVVQGPAGVGKTEVVRAAVRTASGSGMLVLRARGGELETGFGLGVARQLLEPVLRRGAPDDVAVLLEGAGRWAAPALGLADAVLPVPGGDPSFAVRHGLYTLIDALAVERPVLVAVDDAQWADRASLELVAYLAARVEDAAIAVVLAWRTSDPDAVLEAMRREPAVAFRALDSLSLQGTASAVRAQFPTADAAFVEACHTATEGNPFLLHELLRTALRDGIDPVAAEAERVRSLHSDVLRRDVLVRLANLPPEATTVARAMAVLGLDTDRHRIAKVAGLDPGSLAGVVAALQRAAVLAPDEPLRFVHPIVRSVVAGDLTSGERDLLHRSAAEAHAVDGDLMGEAVHRAAVEPSGDPLTVDVLRRAATDALAAGAIDTAVQLLERAVAEPPGSRDLAGTHFDLGSMRMRAGLVASEVLEQAKARSGDPATRWLIAMAIGYDLGQRGRLVEAVDAFADARRVAHDHRALELRTDLARIGMEVMVSKDHSPLRAELPEVIARLPAGSDLHRQAVAAQALELAVHGDSTAEAVAAMARPALEGGDLHAQSMTWAPFATVIDLAYAGALEEVAQYLDQLVAGYARVGHAVGLACAIGWQGQLALFRGELPTALERIEQSLAIVPHDRFLFARPWRAALLADVHRALGDLDAAAAALDDAYRGDEVEPVALNGVFVLISRAAVAVRQGRYEIARRDLEEFDRREQAAGGITVVVANDVARLWHAVGDPVRARRRAEAHLAASTSWGSPSTIGRALRDLGALTFNEGGIEKLHEAVRILESTPCRLDLAQALVDLGAALRRHGDRRLARDPLRRAAELARRCGARDLARQAETEYEATGARARTLAVDGPSSLTPSERRVAQLAAQGRSNPEIAQDLFVSRKTVETHLGSVYRKLGIDNRSALADRADLI